MVKISRFNLSFLLMMAFFLGTLFYGAIKIVSAHGGDSALIHSCVKTSNGSVRVIGASDTCNSGETSLDWNIQGVQGIQGEQGIQGPVGPQGPAGGGSSSSFEMVPFIAPISNLSVFADEFVEKDFSNAQVYGSYFVGVDMHGVIFDYAYMGPIKLMDSNFTDASFKEATLFGSQVGGGNFTNADFTGADMLQADFLYQGNGPANFTNVNFTNADLSQAASMTTTTLDGVIWNNTTCPDTTNSDDNGNTCIGHLVYVEPE